MEHSVKQRPTWRFAITLAVLIFILAGLLVACQRGLVASPPPGVPSGAVDQTLHLQTVTELPLAGGTARFDYQSLDATRQQLYIAHLGASLVTVVDVHIQQVITDIRDIANVHGVLAVPALGKVYASATGSHEVVAIDAQSRRIVRRTAAGNYPDGLAYAPDEGKIFVSDEFGKAVIVLDAHTNALLATIPMEGEVGNTQYDPLSHHILTNVQTRNQIVTIDPKTDQVIARTDVPGCAHPHGLYIEATAQLAFIACEENATLVSLDLASLHVTGTQKTGETPDVLAFDPGLHRLYIAAESGVLTIMTVRGNTMTLFAQGMLAPSAHTVAVDPQTHRLYFPLENSNGQPVLRIMAPL